MFRVGNTQKSLRVGSRKYSAWVMTGVLFSARNSQPWRALNQMRRPNSRRFQTKLSSGASNNGRINGASVCVCVCVCVCARVLLWRRIGKCCHMSYHYSAIPHIQEIFGCPSYMYACMWVWVWVCVCVHAHSYACVQFLNMSVLCGPGSSVSIVTGYRLDGPGIESRWGLDFSHRSRPAMGPTQPPVQRVPGLSRG
jgi:hypothetical protein